MRKFAAGKARDAASAMALAILGWVSAADAGPAVGQFEVKSLDAEPGEVEFQSQNAYSFGSPRRKTKVDADGGIEADDNSLPRARNALELEFGITRYLKTRIGIEYEQERREEFDTVGAANGYEDLKLDEYAAEVILVLKRREGDGVGLGVVVEYEHPAESGGARTLVAGPIFEWASGPWQLTLNPTLVQFFGGERNERGQQDEKIDFAYANHLKYRWSDHIDLSLETYGTLERVGGRGGRSEESAEFGNFDQHRIGPVVYWNFTPPGMEKLEAAGDEEEDEQVVSVGVGTLFGLNDDTPSTTLKLSLEVVF
jgi:hypothetical protein